MQCGLVSLADSHPSALNGIPWLLETVGEVGHDGCQGDALLRAVEKMDPDLVVANLSLPFSGTENVVRIFKKNHPDTTLIVMSMYDDWIVIDEVMEAGAEGSVLRRRIALDLLPAIAALCAGGRYKSPGTDQLELWTPMPTGITKEDT